MLSHSGCLFTAVRTGCLMSVDLLLADGANPFITTSGQTPKTLVRGWITRLMRTGPLQPQRMKTYTHLYQILLTYEDLWLTDHVRKRFIKHYVRRKRRLRLLRESVWGAKVFCHKTGLGIKFGPATIISHFLLPDTIHRVVVRRRLNKYTI